MIQQLQQLTNEDRELLLKAPILISVLASTSFNEVNKDQKADAIKLAHLKTFTADTLLQPYYAEVEKTFKEHFEAALKAYFPFDATKRNGLREEIERLNIVIGKLDKEYALALRNSLEKYAKHVKKAAHSVFQDFIFPIPIPGLTD